MWRSTELRFQILGSGVLPHPISSPSPPEVSAIGHVVSTGPAVSICGTLPWPDAPDGYRLTDDMIDTVLACAGALGEVFHLVRTRRLSQLHKQVPDWLRPGVTAIIIGGYGVAVENTAWDADIVRGLQDLVTSMPGDDDLGLRRRAEELLEDVMARVVTRGLWES